MKNWFKYILIMKYTEKFVTVLYLYDNFTGLLRLHHATLFPHVKSYIKMYIFQFVNWYCC